MWNTLGFEKIKSHFEKIIKFGALNHAYIFTGQEMIGKRIFALELADKLSSSAGDTFNLNKIVIDPADSDSGSSISIENIRNLKNNLSLSSYGGKYKVAIINDAHLMTAEAQNALLKILEEPSPSTIFILITANPTQLLPTVISRCQEIRFPVHKPEIVKNYLSEIEISENQAEFLTNLANGRIGLVKNIIETKDFGKIKTVIEEFADLMKSDINGRFAIAQKMTDDKNKADLQGKLLYWILYLRTKSSEPKMTNILKGLLALYWKTTQPQLNLRLALESFLIQI